MPNTTGFDSGDEEEWRMEAAASPDIGGNATQTMPRYSSSPVTNTARQLNLSERTALTSHTQLGGHIGTRGIHARDDPLEQIAHRWWGHGKMVWYSIRQTGYYFTNLANNYQSPTHIHIYTYSYGGQGVTFWYSMKIENTHIEVGMFCVTDIDQAVSKLTELCRIAYRGKLHIEDIQTHHRWVRPGYHGMVPGYNYGAAPGTQPPVVQPWYLDR